MLVLGVCALAASPASADVFSGFLGEWRGAGAVTLDDGRKEPVRCKVDVLPEAGGRANQALKCAATGYVVVVNASMRVEGDGIVGSWSNDRGKAGALTGNRDGDVLDLRLMGPEINAAMVSTVDDCALSVRISGSMGGIADLAIDLTRAC